MTAGSSTDDALYAQFLPSEWPRDGVPEASSRWWQWRGHHVHLRQVRRESSAVRVLVVHGAGGHSGALWPLVAPLTDAIDVTAVDLPLYGLTRTSSPERVRYGDWVDLLVDLLAAEDDGRPVVLLGASLGGMLAYEVAATSGAVAHVVATCLLDPRDVRVRGRMTRFGWAGVLGGLVSGVVPPRMERHLVPISWVAPLSRMSREPRLGEVCRRDVLGGGARVPIGFLTSFLRYSHTAPERMTTPVTLMHPSEDAWTPPGLSLAWLRRIAAPTRLVMLSECGHFPVEAPGVWVMDREIRRIVDDVAGSREAPSHS